MGHLDLMRVFERAMRRSHFPIAYSQGFNPRPRMSFASALTLGATSAWELCQLELAGETSRPDLDAAVQALQAQLPPGLSILDVWEIPLEKKNPYIQVRAAEYVLTFGGEDPAARLAHFLDEGPGIPQALESALEPGTGQAMLTIKLPAGERAGVRIRDLVADLEQALPGIRLARLHRSRLWCELDPASDHTEPTSECGEASARDGERSADGRVDQDQAAT